MDLKKEFENKRKKFRNKIDKFSSDASYVLNYSKYTKEAKDSSFLNKMKIASQLYSERLAEDPGPKEPNFSNNNISDNDQSEIESPTIPRFNMSPVPSEDSHEEIHEIPSPHDNSNIEVKIHSLNYGIFMNLPTDIDSISKQEEGTKTITFGAEDNDKKQARYENEYIKKIEPVEFSIMKENMYHLDEHQDINFVKDLSSFSRSTYNLEDEKDPGKRYNLNKLSFEMIDPLYYQMNKQLKDPSDQICQDIAANKISDTTLNKIIKDVPMKCIEKDVLNEKYDAKPPIDSEKLSRLALLSKASGLDKEEQEKFQQDNGDHNDLDFDKINTITVLHNIINFKHLKKPLSELPHNFEMMRNIKEDITDKMIHQLNCLCKQIIGKDAPHFEKNVQYIINNMQEFKSQYVQGVNKSRLIKVLFNEVLALKATDDGFFKDQNLGAEKKAEKKQTMESQTSIVFN